MNLIGVAVGKRLYELIPICLFFVDSVTKSSSDDAVVTLVMSVGLWMVGSCRFSSNNEDMADCLPEFGYQLRAVIGKDVVRYTVGEDPVVEHDGRDVGRDGHGHWYRARQLAVAVGNDDDMVVVVARLR